MYRQNQTLLSLLGPTISAMGYELWGMEQVVEGNDALLRVYIEQESGIDLEDCQKVSVQVAGILDVEDPISGRYRLEVSSPGLERPLFTLEQFSRFQGQTVKIHLRKKHMERRRITGVIAEVNEEEQAVIVESEEYEYTISAELIEKAHLVFDFKADSQKQ